MNKLPILLLAAFLAIKTSTAQEFQRYQSFGFQLNVNSSALQTVQSADSRQFGVKAGNNINESLIRFDVLAQYDYGILNWLGFNSGIGLSARGGANRIAVGGVTRSRTLYYLNFPARLQVKPAQWFWIEGGLENMIFLLVTDRNFLPFPEEDISNYHLAWDAGFRFNLVGGLSATLGYGRGINDVGYTEEPNFPSINTTYLSVKVFFGLRYMFNEP